MRQFSYFFGSKISSNWMISVFTISLRWLQAQRRLTFSVLAPLERFILRNCNCYFLFVDRLIENLEKKQQYLHFFSSNFSSKAIVSRLFQWVIQKYNKNHFRMWRSTVPESIMRIPFLCVSGVNSNAAGVNNTTSMSVKPIRYCISPLFSP